MRISTLQIFNSNVDAMMSTQSKINDGQQQVSTGQKIIRDSDDPVTASQLKSLNNTQAQLKLFQGNITSAQNDLSLEESHLQNFTTLITQVSQLSLSSLNGSFNDANRNSIATQLQNQLSALTDIANTKDSNGDYIFSGSQLKTQPFVSNAGSTVYQGDISQRFLNIESSTSVAISDAGNEVFSSKNSYIATPSATNTGTGIISNVQLSNVYTPNTYTITFDPTGTTYGVTDGQGAAVIAAGTAYTDGSAININGMQVSISGTPGANDTYTISKAGNIFSTIQNMITALQSNPSTAAAKAQFTSIINNNISALDAGSQTVLNKLTDVGARLNIVSNTKNVLQSLLLQNGQTISTLGGADLTATVSLLAQQTTTLQAIQKVYVATSSLSLFQLL